MAKTPNAPGGGNRQGPSVSKGGKRGPIVGKMTSVSGTQKPFRMDKGSNKPMLRGNKNARSK